jgi:hypothetical protein
MKSPTPVRGTAPPAGGAKFEAAIDATLAAEDAPALASARQVYADWLEEQNTEDDARLAAAQRWMAETGRRPVQSHTGKWRWCDASARLRPAGPDDIPAELFRALAVPGRLGTLVVFETRPAAEWALAEALAAPGEGRDRG